MARLILPVVAAALTLVVSAAHVVSTPAAAQAPSAIETPASSLTGASPEPSPFPMAITPPAGSQVAYVAGEGDVSPLIHLAATDGSLDTIVASGTLPSWAPDGQRMAYTCKPRRIDDVGSLCIRDFAAGTDVVAIKQGTLASWSPSGDVIAFSRDVWSLGDAWIYRLDPRRTWQLPGGQPDWSPTGEWLRFLTARGVPERPVVHVVRPDGSDARSLGLGWNAAWSPEGDRIAVTWWHGSRSAVTAIDIESGERTPLFETDAPILALRWLPGDGFAFVAERNESSTGDLRIFELSSGDERSLTSGLAVTPDLTVSPDGQWCAFTVAGEEGSDIYIAARQGGWARLTSGAQATRPAWRPGSGR